MGKNLNTILVFGLVMFLGLWLVQLADAGKATQSPTSKTPPKTTTVAPPTTTAGPTTTRKYHYLDPIFRFIKFGFSMYKQTLFDLSGRRKTIFNGGVTKVDETCFGSESVPVWVHNCTERIEDIPRVYIYYNESHFRDVLFHPMGAVQRPLNYPDTLNLTSYYSRVYTEAIYYVNLLQINLIPTDYLKDHMEDDFKGAVQNLPKDQNKTVYDAFIDMYGTHYLANTVVGGYLRMQGLTEETEFDFEGEEEAAKIVNATILQFFEKNGRMHVPDEWVDATPKRVFVNGGDQNMGTIKFHTQAVQWHKTVGLPNYPLAINGLNFQYLFHLFAVVNKTYAKEKEENFKERIEYHNLKYKLDQIVAGLEIAQTDPNAKGTHGCFNTDLLYKYFDDLRNDEKFDEKMKTQEYLDREFCATSTLNYVALMRRFFHTFNDTVPGFW